MSTPRAFITASFALALTSVTFFPTSASGQSDATRPIESVNTPQAVTDSASTSAVPASTAARQLTSDRYRDGIVIWQTPDDATVLFLLMFNINTQLRYLNTQSSEEEFTDHLGNSHEVHIRNDITVNRAMFVLGGHVFDRAPYSGAFTPYTAG